MLYAWCRYCDDVIDGQELGFAVGGAVPALQRDRALEHITTATREALAGRAERPEFVALQRVVEDAAIPHRHPMELIEGFAMDVAGRRYLSLEDTLEYCYHVAGVVGVMMAHVMGVRDRATLERAQDLGIAFQLTNIARDVLDDWRAGRVYLPREFLDAEGLADADIGDPVHRDSLAKVVARLLAVADTYYDSAREGLPALPLRCAWAVAAARVIYRDIGTLVRQRGEDAWTTRASVGRARKTAALAEGLSSALASRLPRAVRPPPRPPTLWTKQDLAAS